MLRDKSSTHSKFLVFDRVAKGVTYPSDRKFSSSSKAGFREAISMPTLSNLSPVGLLRERPVPMSQAVPGRRHME